MATSVVFPCFFPSFSAMNTKLPHITKQDQLNREAELYEKHKLGNPRRGERYLGSFSLSKFTQVNAKHNYKLLVDVGTVRSSPFPAAR